MRSRKTIDTVLSAKEFAGLGLTFVGSAPPLNDIMGQMVDPHIRSASVVNDRYDDLLLKLPEAVGHGVGYSRDGSRKAVIKLFLRMASNRALQAAPHSLGGVPVEIEDTGKFRVSSRCKPVAR